MSLRTTVIRRTISIALLGVLAVAFSFLTPNVSRAAVIAAIAWDPNTEPDVAGYRLHCGTSSHNYSVMIDVGPQTSGQVPNLQRGKTYYFAVTAYNSEGTQSDFSEEISYTVPLYNIRFPDGANPARVTIWGEAGQRYRVQVSSNLRTWETVYSVTFTMKESVEFVDEDSLLNPVRFYRIVQ